LEISYMGIYEKKYAPPNGSAYVVKRLTLGRCSNV
jgi:hypothetical protein